MSANFGKNGKAGAGQQRARVWAPSGKTAAPPPAQPRLMAVLAHPDDESLGLGGTLARYAGAGAATYLLTATGGGHGWPGDPAAYPGHDALVRQREQELRAAARVLGLSEVALLDYQDGQLDQANPRELLAAIVSRLRLNRPHVVVTFDPFGSYGHPDHIAISQATTAAVTAAADPAFLPDLPPHRVSKLHYMVETWADLRVYQEAFGDLVMAVDGVARRAAPWPEWAVTTRVDTSAYAAQVWEAIACHRSQVPAYAALRQHAESRQLWQSQTFYRAMSLVNGGRETEEDLFAGVRVGAAEAWPGS